MENENNGENNSFIKKIIEFVKKNPALSGTFGTVILYVLGIFLAIILLAVIIYIVISSLTLLWGTPTNWITKGEYKEYSLEDFQTQDFSLGSCYQAQAASEGDEKTPLGIFFDSVWERAKSSLSAGINDKCEFIKVVTGEIEDAENKYKDYGLKISSGLVTSTIIYQYSSVVVSEGEERVAPGNPGEVLEDIVNENLITRAKIKSIVDNMILKESYWYYNCNEVTCRVNGEEVEDTDTIDETDESSSIEFEIKSGKQCVRNFYFNVKFSKEKYFTYLRYGEEAAAYYETAINHNESTKYSCDECYKKWNDDNYNMVQIDVSKYLSVANTKTNEADDIIISLSEEELKILQKEINESKRVLKSLYKKPSLSSKKEFTYKDGIIYNDFKDFKPSFDSGRLIEDPIFTPKTIELTVESVDSYEDSANNIYGIDEDSIGVGKPNLSYTSEEKAKKVCPTEEPCECVGSNGTPGSSSNFGYAGSLSACSYLAAASTTMVRLYSCTGKYENFDLPGGHHTGSVNGITTEIANDVISLEQYIKGTTLTEMSISGVNIEAIKFQMLMVQTNLFYHVGQGQLKFNDANELMVKNGSCFQNYNDSKYHRVMGEERYSSKVNEAYAEVNDKLFINTDGNITNADWKATFSDEVKLAANSGLKYNEILTWDGLKSKKDYPKYETAEVKTCSDSSIAASGIVGTALSYVGKDTGRDCSGFVTKVFRENGYELKKHSGTCSGATRRSHGWYLQYKKAGNYKWLRTSGSSMSAAMSTFPGNCQPGDIIFFTSGNNDCVRHVAIYVGEENGEYMIVDTTIANHVAQHRPVDSIGNFIPIICVDPLYLTQ